MMTAGNVARPFLTIPSGAVEATPWMISVNDGEALADPDYVEGWDYGATLGLNRIIRPDTDKICEALRIRKMLLDLELIVRWGTGDTVKPRVSGILSREKILVLGGGKEIGIEREIPGEGLSGKLFLETSIILRKPPPGAKGIVPHLKGLVLWRDVAKVRIEGDMTRFPVQEASFEKFSYPHALWLLQHDPTDMGTPLLSGVRLYLNSNVPDFIDRILSGDPFLSQAMMADVIGQMLEPILGDSELLETMRESEDNESVGYQIRSWIEDIFGTPSEARNLLQNAPEKFRALINDYTYAATGDEK